MNSKSYLLILLLIGFSTLGFSQEIPPKPSFWKNVRFGGNLGLGFSNNRTNIVVSPSAVYQFNNQFSAGASVNFGYNRFKNPTTTSYNYGGGLLAFYNPTREIQLSAEFEQTFVNQRTKLAGTTISDDFNFPALYLGAGYRLGNVTVGVRYDVLYNRNNSLYGSAYAPFARVYF